MCSFSPKNHKPRPKFHDYLKLKMLLGPTAQAEKASSSLRKMYSLMLASDVATEYSGEASQSLSQGPWKNELGSPCHRAKLSSN